MIIIPLLKLAYAPSPKVGSTSVLDWLYEHWTVAAKAAGKKVALVDSTAARHLFTRGREGNLLVRNSPDVMARYPDYFTFGIVREPIARFISVYRNRVVFYREISEMSDAGPGLAAAGLPFDPQLNELVRRYDAYAKYAGAVEWHARQQWSRLGPDISVYDRVYDLKNLNTLIEDIRSHWRKVGLSDLADLNIELKTMRADGPKLGLEALDEESFELLGARYATDYANLPVTPLEKVREDYKKARAANPNPPPVEFTSQLRKRAAMTAAVARGEGGDPTKARGAAAMGGAGMSRSMGGWTTRIAPTPDEVTQLQLRMPPAPPVEGQPWEIRGVVVMAPDVDRKDCELYLTMGEQRLPCGWALPSPRIAKTTPDNPNAAKARFQTPPLPWPPLGDIRLMLRIGEESHVLGELIKN